MEKLTKEYFWVAHLALLALMAYLSALVSSNLLAGAIMTLPTSPAASEAKVAKAEVKRKGELKSAVVDRNLFNANPPEEVEPCEGPDCPKDDSDGAGGDGIITDRIPKPGEECAESKLKMELAGIMKAEPSKWSVAIFRTDGGDRMIKEQQKVGELTLAAIQRQRVVLHKDNRFECLSLDLQLDGPKKRKSKGGARGSDLRSSKRSRSRSKPGSAKGIAEKVGKDRFKVDRNKLVEHIDTGKHLKDARALPSYKNGKSQGIKIVGLRPNSLYKELGLRSGDIIKAVGDEEIAKPTQALRMFDKIKDSESITIEVQRHGRPVTLEYSLE